ncbi:MerR family DNA-binding transcriptional regulator, partial [Enterobacter hormaechei subsp. steigerwaltii]|nr:MerR family DNA-binding transcriptional regulator [Enterobacter hormaechei subsp. steigerwaltii]
MGSCAAPSAKGDDKFITTDYLQQCHFENLTIGVFAKAAGVNVETIRFYQRKGLLPEPDKPYGSIRR